MKSTATKHVMDVLNELSGYFGIPARIVSFRGKAFKSRTFEQYCKVSDIKHITNAERTPRAKEHAERTKGTIL